MAESMQTVGGVVLTGDTASRDKFERTNTHNQIWMYPHQSGSPGPVTLNLANLSIYFHNSNVSFYSIKPLYFFIFLSVEFLPSTHNTSIIASFTGFLGPQKKKSLL